MKKSQIVLVVFAMSLTFSIISFTKDWGNILEQHMKTITTLKIKFKQINYWNINHKKLVSNGEILIKRPNYYKIEYTDTENQMYLFDGKNAWFYSIKDKQVIKSSKPDPTMQLSNYILNLNKIFNIKYIGEDKKDKNLIKFDLKYKTNDYNVAGIRLWLNKNTFLPKQLEILSLSKDSVVYIFQKIEKNKPISSDKFKPNFPKDVDIIEY